MSGDPTSWRLEQRAATDFGEIAWDVLGDGPPVVLVHGTPSRSVLWRDVAPLLAERSTVYVFDLLGYGQSERREQQDVSIRIQPRCSPSSCRAGDWRGRRWSGTTSAVPPCFGRTSSRALRPSASSWSTRWCCVRGSRRPPATSRHISTSTQPCRHTSSVRSPRRICEPPPNDPWSRPCSPPTSTSGKEERLAEFRGQVQRPYKATAATTADERATVAVVGRDEQRQTLEAQYVVGADRGHSVVRDAAGISSTGIAEGVWCSPGTPPTCTASLATYRGTGRRSHRPRHPRRDHHQPRSPLRPQGRHRHVGLIPAARHRLACQLAELTHAPS